MSQRERSAFVRAGEAQPFALIKWPATMNARQTTNDRRSRTPQITNPADHEVPKNHEAPQTTKSPNHEAPKTMKLPKPRMPADGSLRNGLHGSQAKPDPLALPRPAFRRLPSAGIHDCGHSRLWTFTALDIHAAGLTAPALTAPALTAPALTAPALTAPALTAPAIHGSNWSHRPKRTPPASPRAVVVVTICETRPRIRRALRLIRETRFSLPRPARRGLRCRRS